MTAPSTGFPAEYLAELGVARVQLLALADSVPEDSYSWSPAGGARTFSAVLVHIATVNLALLRLAGVKVPGTPDLYEGIQGEGFERMAAMIRRNVALEKTATGKEGAIDLLRRSFDAVQRSFCAGGGDLDRECGVLGPGTTVRRVFLRILAHSHEHMGQAVAYTRAAGMQVPWPDPLREFD